MIKRNRNGEDSGVHLKGTRARQNAVTATNRTIEVHDRVRVMADRCSRAIDDLTMPGVPITITDEDSVVTTLEAMIEERKGKAASG